MNSNLTEFSHQAWVEEFVPNFSVVSDFSYENWKQVGAKILLVAWVHFLEPQPISFMQPNNRDIVWSSEKSLASSFSGFHVPIFFQSLYIFAKVVNMFCKSSK